MEVLTDPGACPATPGGSVVTIGSYDGVHLGHRTVLANIRRWAGVLGAATAVVTFEPHPARLVRPGSAPELLTHLDHKLELLAAAGVDRTVVVPFDEARRAQTAAAFVEEVLVRCLGARAVAVGHDFHFGHRREGTVPFLQAQGAVHGFDVLGMHLHHEAGAPVSSTRIRALVHDGDVAGAAALLGRPHEVRGVVEPGDQRGREWGFPTANVAVAAGTCLPADGVYAGWYVHADGTESPAAISLGRRPQVYEDRGERLLEPHLIGWSGDLYGQVGRVRFVQRLRGQEVFPSVDELLAQIRRDVDEAAAVLR